MPTPCPSSKRSLRMLVLRRSWPLLIWPVATSRSQWLQNPGIKPPSPHHLACSNLRSCPLAFTVPQRHSRGWLTMSFQTESSSPVPTLMMWWFSAELRGALYSPPTGFWRLEATGLTVKFRKCLFGETKVPHLDHVVGVFSQRRSIPNQWPRLMFEPF